jgi:hypothetical protein
MLARLLESFLIKDMATLQSATKLTQTQILGITTELGAMGDAVDKQTQEQAKARASVLALEKSFKDFVKTTDALAAAFNALSGQTSNAVADFEVASGNISQEISRIISGDESIVAQNRVNPFENIQGRTTGELESGIRNIINSTNADPAAFEGVASSLVFARDLPSDLKAVVDNLKARAGSDANAGSFNTVNILDEFKSVSKEFGNLPDGVRKDFENNLRGLLESSRQGTDDIGIEAAATALESGTGDIVSQLTETTKAMQDSLATTTNNVNSFNKAVIESTNIQLQASRIRAAAELDAVNRNQKLNDILLSATPNDVDPVQRAESQLRQRVATTLGPLSGVSGADLLNPEALAADRANLEARKTNLTGRLAGLQGDPTSKAFQDVQKKLADVSQALEGNTSATEMLSSDMSTLEAVQNKLAAIQNSRLSNRQKLAAVSERLSQAKNPEERNKILQETFAAPIAAAKAALGQTLSTSEAGALATADPEQLKAFGVNALQAENFAAGASQGLIGAQTGVAGALFQRQFALGTTTQGSSAEEVKNIDIARSVNSRGVAAAGIIAERQAGGIEAQIPNVQNEIALAATRLESAATKFAELRSSIEVPADKLNQAADKLQNLPTIKMEMNGKVSPVEVLINGGQLMKDFGEEFMKRVGEMIAEAIQQNTNPDGTPKGLN